MLNNDMIKCFPGIFIAFDRVSKKAICVDGRDKGLLFGISESADIFELFSKYPQISELTDGALNGKDGREVLTVNNRLISFSVNSTDSAVFILGMDVTGLMPESYIDMNKPKDAEFGIYTKESAIDFIDYYLKRTASGKTYFSLVFLNMDNDRSDCCYKNFIDAVMGSIRSTDVFACTGDAEFIILLPKCPSFVANNIIATIENKLNLLQTSEGFEDDFALSFAVKEINQENIGSVNTADKAIEMVKAML